MAPALTRHPHEARVQRYAYGALAGALVADGFLALITPGDVLGVRVPLLATLGLALAAAVVGVVGVARRSGGTALAAAGLLAASAVPGGASAPGVLAYAAGLLLGGLLLAFGELAHQTARYERAHRVIEEEHVGEESLDRVTDEALRTLGERALLALGVAAAPVALALLLSWIGPAPWREGLETASPLGAAVLALAVFAGIAIFILTRGAKLRDESSPKEVVAVAEMEIE
jgi:hypothetical protein